jgi:hypothetical protein
MSRPHVCLASRVLVTVLAICGQAGAAIGHGSHGGPGGGSAHAGAGIATIRPDESLKLSVDLLGYLSGSLASEWRTGEPLGAGGKIPLFYNQNLHLEAPFERAGPAKRDYWPQYRDFSYIPVWLPSQLGARVHYRFLRTLAATVSAVYFGSVDRATLEPNPLEFEEMFVRWTPESVAGLSLSIGQLFLLGAYSPSFDQFPLESFRFNLQSSLSGWRPRAQPSVLHDAFQPRSWIFHRASGGISGAARR